ncbi:MAG: O-antigen ligase family protein [Clostridia bacterium]|nr:O-antigen ligase family protein [Clostridia bacterium]
MRAALMKYKEGLYRLLLSLLVFLVAVLTGGETERLAPFVVALLLLLCVGLLTQSHARYLTLPFLHLTLLLIFCYDSFSVFIGYIWLLPIVVIAMAVHLWRLGPRARRGMTLPPLLAVSAATLLGGVGMISPADYFRPASLVFMAGLGPGLVLSYWIMKRELEARESREALKQDLLWWGVVAMAVVFWHVMPLILENGVLYIAHVPQWSNNISTMLMIAMPAAFAQKRRGLPHYMIAALMFAAVMLIGSRGGQIFVGVELLVCCLVAWLQEKEYLARIWNRFYFLLALLGVGYLLWFLAANGDAFALVSTDETRFNMLLRGFEDFCRNPLFGSGIGYRGNADLYLGKQGTINWYHVFVAQVVGGLGLCGILAWSYQLYTRFCLAWRVRGEREVFFALCYLGLLLMSMVNPGEFCPVPYAFLAVTLFVALENHLEQSTPQ